MRDYKEFPLKYGERIPKEDLLECYINKNISKKQCANIFGCSIPKVDKDLKFYCIEKDNKSIIECRKLTNVQKYGCEHVLQNKQIQQKVKQTSINKYGVENYNQTIECKNKKKETMQQRYGVDNPAQLDDYRDKYNKTCMEKYGVNNIFENTQYIKQCVTEKYGVDNYFKTEEFQIKSKNTCKQKYGVEYCSQSPEVRRKIEQTNLDRYGTKCSAKSVKVKEKAKQTFLHNYGVDNPSKVPEVINKIDETKSKNHTHNTSKDEEIIYELLKKKYEIVKRQYKNSLYPTKVDFYIPEVDLYIEYQRFWTHGKEPFDKNNPQHKRILKLWKLKSQEFNSYKNELKNTYLEAINTWTKSDPIKRQTAKNNNLNWIEFFTMEQFMDWYNS